MKSRVDFILGREGVIKEASMHTYIIGISVFKPNLTMTSVLFVLVPTFPCRHSTFGTRIDSHFGRNACLDI